MSGFGLHIEIKDGATQALARKALALQPARLLPVAGRAAASLVRAHFIELNGQRHRPGGANFYLSCARATHSEVVGDAAVVSVTQQGAGQRFHGGVIEAKPGGWLTIPARDETYGHRAREFTDLVFVKFRAELAALIQRAKGAIRRSVTPGARRAGEEVGGGIFYWLTKRVDQRPDPSVLPPLNQIEDAALNAVGQHVAGKN